MNVIVEEDGADALLRVIVALGDYSHEADQDLGHRRHRARADIGVLLNRAKYHPESPRSQEDAQANLVGLLLKELESDPRLAVADAVVAVPSSRGTFSNDIAADLEHGLKIPVYIGRARVQGGRAAKNHAVKRQYDVDTRLDDMSVVIFDDVYDTGSSLYALASAAIAAGAKNCAGLVIARKLSG
ncbi:phosphoribosyltransferase [Conexibacter woesei]|uniref:phosphoribosyltransferase n=1 Tax=Conexibacter woesei TaxID=191495 RepID=UPI00047DEA52|nr:phosphoribosyltransferase [Conexibacter woesei]